MIFESLKIIRKRLSAEWQEMVKARNLLLKALEDRESEIKKLRLDNMLLKAENSVLKDRLDDTEIYKGLRSEPAEQET